MRRQAFPLCGEEGECDVALASSHSTTEPGVSSQIYQKVLMPAVGSHNRKLYNNAHGIISLNSPEQ